MNYENEFWLIIKDSGKNCNDINKIRNEIRKIKGKEFLDNSN